MARSAGKPLGSSALVSECWTSQLETRSGVGEYISEGGKLVLKEKSPSLPVRSLVELYYISAVMFPRFLS